MRGIGIQPLVFAAVATLLGLTTAAPTAPDALERGQAAFRRGNWAEAEKSFLAALREKPGSAAALKWLGMAYAAQEKFDVAEARFRRACQIDPREDLACYYLGRADYALSRYQESLAAFETALSYQPDSNRIRRGMGLTLEALGRTAEAERYLKLAAASNDREAQSDYGQFLFRQGRIEESVGVLQRSAGRPGARQHSRPSPHRCPSRRDPPLPRRTAHDREQRRGGRNAPGSNHDRRHRYPGLRWRWLGRYLRR